MADETSGFGARLRAHRHAANLTLEALGERSGVSARAISDMERGRSRGPQARTVEALADALALTGETRAAFTTDAGRGRTRRPGPVPDALPAVDELFVGRAADRAALADALTAAGGALPVVLSGPGGIGKTTLAVRAVRDVADAFPDGVRFVSLDGQTATPLPPGLVAARLLLAGGVPEADVPHAEADRYRALATVLTGTRALVVLDDARDEAQVRPLLAHRGGSAVLVTSRRALGGIDAADRITLDPLSGDDARSLLEAVLGRAHSASHSASHRGLGELADVCGRFPLALRIVANRLLSRPGWSVQTMLDRLDDESARLARLRAGDVRVESAFEMSYLQLRPVEQRVFRRLSLVEGPSWSTAAAAVLGGVGEDVADEVLDDLAELQLVVAPADGRHAFHDLVRLFAADRLTRDESPAEIERARVRHRNWLLATAVEAGRWFEPTPHRVTPLRAAVADRDDARAWLAAESANWLAALRAAAAEGADLSVVEVAEAMHWYSDLEPFWEHWYEVFELARQAAQRLGDLAVEATQTNYLAWVAGMHGDPAGSVELARRAADLATRAGDDVQVAWAREYTASAHTMMGRPDLALPASRSAAEAFGRAGDLASQLTSLDGVALSLVRLHRLDEGLEQVRENLDYIDGLVDLPPAIAAHARAVNHGIAGDAHLEAGRFADAVAEYEASLESWRRGGFTAQQARAASRLARALVGLGDRLGARDAAQWAADLASTHGDPRSLGRAQQVLDELGDDPVPVQDATVTS